MLGIWVAVALVSVFAPTLVTGSDPTTVPIAGLVSLSAGAVATGFACLAAASSAVPKRAFERPPAPGCWRRLTDWPRPARSTRLSFPRHMRVAAARRAE
jgi:hypothetical protein